MELHEGQPVEPVMPEQSEHLDHGTEIIDPTHSFSWEASEYVFHEKRVSWYAILFVVTAAMVGGLVFFQQWLSAVVVAVMLVAVLVYSKKAPRTLQYHLDSMGITVDGKSSPYANFHSYSVHNDVAWHAIDLEPAKRFATRLTVLCDAEQLHTVETILQEHLPRMDRHLDIIERLTRYLKF